MVIFYHTVFCETSCKNEVKQDLSRKCSAWKDFYLKILVPPPHRIGLSMVWGGGVGMGGQFFDLR